MACCYICEIIAPKLRENMKKIFYLLLIPIGLGFFACNNEVDLTGNYKDTPVVFCLLNPTDSAHYIRIQKAFLVDGNVLETAKIPDSLKYDPADLDVKVIESNATTGAITKTITFAHQPGAVTDTGVFAKEGVMIYKSTESLNDLRKYKLQITNNKLNKQITAETGLVYGFVFKNPSVGTIIFNGPSGYTLRWISATNGQIYQPEIILHWNEVDLATNVATPDSVVWSITPKEAASTGQFATEMDLNLPRNSFYQFVGQSVKPKPGIKRVIGYLTFRFYVGTSELATYVNVNKPSIGLIQDKPIYSNINGGLGLFAGRSTFSKPGMSLAETAKDTLISGTYTSGLSFRRN